jgi:hypothetical protein
MSKGLTEQEARQWCERNGIALDTREPDGNKLGSGILFSIPENAASRIGLAQTLYPSTWDVTGAVLIWTKEWSVWPSCEHVPLFTRFRQALGESRPLSVARAQLFEASEVDDAQSHLILHSLFLWDCWVVAEGGTYVVHFSHDEWGQLFAEPATFARAREYLMRSGVARQEG